LNLLASAAAAGMAIPYQDDGSSGLTEGGDGAPRVGGGALSDVV